MKHARFTFEIRTALASREAWRRIVDVSEHGEVVPLTRGHGPAPEDAVIGSRYVARTAVGPVGFDDIMEVRSIEPGRSVVFEKVGRLLGGMVDVEVTPLPPAALGASEAEDDGGSRVAWNQTITLPWVPTPLRPVAGIVTRAAAPVIGMGYRQVVSKLLDPRR